MPRLSSAKLFSPMHSASLAHPTRTRSPSTSCQSHRCSIYLWDPKTSAKSKAPASAFSSARRRQPFLGACPLCQFSYPQQSGHSKASSNCSSSILFSFGCRKFPRWRSCQLLHWPCSQPVPPIISYVLILQGCPCAQWTCQKCAGAPGQHLFALCSSFASLRCWRGIGSGRRRPGSEPPN